MYSDNKPLKLFADPLTHNLHQMNSIYEEIEYLFVHAGVKNFEKLPELEAERKRFRKTFSTCLISILRQLAYKALFGRKIIII